MSRKALRGSVGQWVILTLAFGFFSSLWLFNHPSVVATLAGGDAVATSTVTAPPTWLPFDSTKLGFSVMYPPGYIADSSYVYTELGPRGGIKGAKFTIPPDSAKGTNLAHADTGVSIEVLPGTSPCTGNSFVEEGIISNTLTEGGVTYSVVKTAGAGAGNLYEETVYAIEGSVPCTAVRYFIHSTNIKNYAPGSIAQFDKPALLKEFDMIRRSLVLARTP